MSANAPLVSVIIAAHNSEATLGETIASALASTYPNIEIIVVDDGSTDQTPRIARNAATRDGRVQVYRTPQAGVWAAHRLGVRHARGDYVAFLDSDDLWHPAKLAKQVELAAADPELAFIYTFYRSIDATGRVLHDGPQQRFPRRALCRSIHESLVGTGSSALIRRSLLEMSHDQEIVLGARQDQLTQLMIAANHPIGFVPEFLVGYRVSPRSLSGNPDMMLQSWMIVRHRIRNQFPQVPPFVLRWTEAKQCIDLAEGFAWRRRFGSALALGLRALLNDPLRISLFVNARLSRRLFHRRQTPQPYTLPLFSKCDPACPVAPPASLDGAWADLLKRLDRRRAERLDEIDEKLAARFRCTTTAGS